MLKKLKSLFKLKTIDNVQNKEFYDIVLAIVAEIQTQSDSSFFLTTGVKFSNLDSYSQFKKKDTLYKKHFALWLLQDIIRIYNKNSKSHNLKDEREVFSVQQELLSLLFRSNLELTIPEYIDCLIFFKNNKLLYGGISSWPIGFLLLQLERKVKKEGLSEELELFLNEMLTWESIKRRNNYCGADISKVRNRIKAIISFSNKKICQRFTFNSEEFGDYANQVLENHNEKEKETLYQILALSKKVSGSKPTKKFSKESSLLIDKLDFTDYKTFIYSLLERVIKLQPKEEIHTYGNQEYSFSTYTFIEKENLNILKGLVWTLTKFYDKNTVILISKLAEKCFKKIPGVGQTAGALGNACLYTLANIKGRDGIAQLTVLQNKIKQTSTKKLIEKYISEISLKLGISKSDIEESIVSEFNLIDGSKEVFFEDYKLKISIERIGKVQKLWIKPDGKIQKTEPSFIKNSKSLSEKFKKIKLEIKEIQKFVSSQRDRLDGLFIEERTVNYTNFSKFYLNHGLISFLSKKLIWIVKNENKQEACFYLKDKWVNACQKEINWIDEGCSFQLWHPIYGTTNEVLEWRNFLVKFQITQPLKQAFRELYLLTEAEVNTKTYSNRMASHILKQHQFNMLAKVRNWNYQLVGAWDHGLDCIARRNLTIENNQYEVEFWLNEITTDDLYNDTGIYLYMSTDQVRYYINKEHVDLVDVPAIIFSETMRDVDLFVGVASVGNDPEWSDNGGLPQHRDYWQSYSFGDLTEVAKTRKTILKSLLPRLKIKEVAKIEGKFLIVKGTLRTYKIHIGSTNILMEPNDEYLCIVPSGKKDVTEKIFLPFEGDKGLSVILSKAFLLAEDKKIIDSTITSQINRN